MSRVQVYTLFDITYTGIIRTFNNNVLPIKTYNGNKITTEAEWLFARRQQSNYETLLQVLSLRIQLFDVKYPKLKKYKDLINIHPDISFGNAYDISGDILIWSFIFRHEAAEALSANNSPVGLLYSDCANVPIMCGLTSNIESKYIDISTEHSNIYFKEIEID
jgi:hypothetical protein